MANVAGVFNANGNSTTIIVSHAKLSVTLWGVYNAMTILQASYNKGSTWVDVQQVLVGRTIIEEAERGVYYRLNCSMFVSGPANYRLGTSEVQ